MQLPAYVNLFNSATVEVTNEAMFKEITGKPVVATVKARVLQNTGFRSYPGYGYSTPLLYQKLLNKGGYRKACNRVGKYIIK